MFPWNFYNGKIEMMGTEKNQVAYAKHMPICLTH